MKQLIAHPQRNLWSGILFGLGVAAFIDEVVFHQLLAWHHFYDKSSMAIGLVSDGLFHAFSWFATVASLFLLADIKRRNSFWVKRWVSGMLLGLGFFQLYDGLIQHKIFQIHQIRYEVNVLPYDIVWNAIAVIILIVGFIVFIQTQKYIRRKRG
ncbi:DUF2243 domain-containing protein [Staphylococcus shinii]|jgi:uncharacterized membrane protein|uniref:DUF2243 domain-containing protein n=1 Tax=Staphylococcus TaxID=1279 RepID=UPI000852B63A|nr:DUF2243 domain-containing protein [Staphylococcus shinii]MBO3064884.1 DUF2243 domain-containing protein [Staphylococcus shinii]MDW8569835.1 DUF2243 domain-containing protein [Staphylococcus shinii]MDW8574263.1 DUF2243 domain-containing protein [Staphylococcus shinii]MEC5301653.1 DUF2243 domain-containing protein [Staphylococcus shinii]OEK83640.1 hypothetical protein AST15_11810 [Staphylococcus shinii]